MDEQQASLDYLINQVRLFFFFFLELCSYCMYTLIQLARSIIVWFFLMFRNLFSAYYVRDTIVKCRQIENNNQKKDLHLKIIQSEQGVWGVGQKNVLKMLWMLLESCTKAIQNLSCGKFAQITEIMNWVMKDG